MCAPIPADRVYCRACRAAARWTAGSRISRRRQVAGARSAPRRRLRCPRSKARFPLTCACARLRLPTVTAPRPKDGCGDRRGPVDLLRGRLTVRRLGAAEIALLRLPAAGSPQPELEPTSFAIPELPVGIQIFSATLPCRASTSPNPSWAKRSRPRCAAAPGWRAAMPWHSSRSSASTAAGHARSLNAQKAEFHIREPRYRRAVRRAAKNPGRDEPVPLAVIDGARTAREARRTRRAGRRGRRRGRNVHRQRLPDCQRRHGRTRATREPCRAALRGARYRRPSSWSAATSSRSSPSI